MEAAQPTLADILGHPLVLLVCTSILALIAWLLSRQIGAMDKRDDKHDSDLEELKEDMVEQRLLMKEVRKALGLSDRPSDSKRKSSA